MFNTSELDELFWILNSIKGFKLRQPQWSNTTISALIDRHRPHTLNTPDEVNILGTGINANINDKEGTKMAQPPYKKATKASQIKSSHNKGTKPNKDMSDALLGDPIVNTKKNTKKAKATEQTDSIDENDVRIFEFVFEGLPNQI